jgi:hypothetical protein
MAETKRQKDKKNKNRPKAGDIGYVSSIQKNYTKKVENKNQITLF